MARTSFVKGEAALEALMARGLVDWQAKKMLGVARKYGLVNFPIDGDRDVMSVQHEDGLFMLGPFVGYTA